MRDTKSLLSKIALNNILTPYEAIVIQHLNMRQMKRLIPDISDGQNLYSMTDKVTSLYSSLELKQMLSFNTLHDAQEYDAYKWAADLLVNYDNQSDEVVQKGIALFNELRCLRDEHLITLLIEKNNSKIEPLENFSAFSQVYQKRMSFQEIMESYVITVKILVTIADNVLTLNYFLSGLVELPDLLCFTNLKKILPAKDNNATDEDQIIIPFHITKSTYKQLCESVISDNHSNFVQFMNFHLSLFSWQISPSFKDDSRGYVRKTVDIF